MGVATERDLRDYFRLPVAEAQARGSPSSWRRASCCRSTVEGWSKPAYLAPGGAVPRRVDARALLGPFDSLIWERDRGPSGCSASATGSRSTCRRSKRVHGYYVLPFLLGERLVARVDLKADRQAGVLRVQAAHAEPGAPPETAGASAGELERDGRLARPRARRRGRRPRRPRPLNACGGRGSDPLSPGCRRNEVPGGLTPCP